MCSSLQYDENGKHIINNCVNKADILINKLESGIEIDMDELRAELLLCDKEKAMSYILRVIDCDYRLSNFEKLLNNDLTEHTESLFNYLKI